jgi:hypothetical protein
MLAMQAAQFVELGHPLATALPIGVKQPVRRFDQRGSQRHVLAALAESSRDLGLAVAAGQALLHEQRDFQRLQPFALLVLDHLVIVVGGGVDEGRNLGQAGQLGRTQAAGAEVEHPSAGLLIVWAHRDRLPHTAVTDRRSQFQQTVGIELVARLLGVFVDAVDRQQHRPAARVQRRLVQRGQVVKLQGHVRPPAM